MIKKILIIIIIASFIVRFIDQGYPPLLWDEASLGYNAYSIIKTTKDEYGSFLPIIFKSFGDYKPGLYVYLAIPFIAIFGLNETSVRLPSIILGSLLPLLIYLLITTINPKSTKQALIAAAILAFNPWNIHFSRGAWETNILLFEIMLGSYLFLKNKYYLSAIVLGASLFTYQASKLLVPFMVINLIFYKKSFPLKFIVTLGLFFIPIVYGLIFGADGNRLKVMNLTAYNRPQTEINTITKDDGQFNYQLFYSHPIFVTRNFFTRYFNYYSSKFLAFDGDWSTARHSAPYVGLMLYPTYFFLIIGLLIALKSFSQHRFFIYWLIFAPIPAALSLDIIQAVRALNLSIPLIYFASLGLSRLLTKKTIILISISYVISFAYYWDLYRHHLIQIKPEQSLVGYKEAVNFLNKNKENRHLIFTNFYGQAYIYYLFYNQYPPQQYQKQAKLINNGVDTGIIEKIDNIEFKTPDITRLYRSSEKVTAIIAYDEIIRQGYQTKDFIKISPIFYAYQN